MKEAAGRNQGIGLRGPEGRFPPRGRGGAARGTGVVRDPR